MIKFNIIAALAIFPLPALAGPTTCLQDLILAPSVELEQTADTLGQTVTVEANLSNGLDIALAGLMVEYQLWSNDRPVALSSGTVSAVISIPGGLMPGEEFAFESTIWLDDRALKLAQDASSLELRFVILNALSSDNNRHAQEPTMLGWSGSGVAEVCGNR